MCGVVPTGPVHDQATNATPIGHTKYKRLPNCFKLHHRFLSNIIYSFSAMGKEQDLLDYINGLDKEKYNSLKNSPEKVIETINEFIRTRERLMVIGVTKGNFIIEEMKKASPTLMIELGCYVGYSAVLFGNELRKINASTRRVASSAKYYSFEANPEFAAIAKQIVDLAGLSDIVEIVVGKAGDTLPDFEQKLAREFNYTSVDFVFIDHWKDLYIPDLRVLESLSLIAPGTVICADNIYIPGAPEYAKYMQSDPQQRKAYNDSVPNTSGAVYTGRWNITYDSKTVPMKVEEMGAEDAVEVSTCKEFLSG